MDCVRKINNKLDMRRYFWENHREWKERIWDVAQAKAEKAAATNAVYLKASDERRGRILEQLTCQQVPGVMGMMYQYFDPEKSSKAITFDEAMQSGEIKDEFSSEMKTFSEEFNGYFNEHELKYLKQYYQGLEEDFDLNDINLRDTAIKVAKASLLADRAWDDYRSGRCDFSVVKDATALFDTLSKSGNFAACKRKPGDTSGLGSWAELTAKLESSGHPCTRKIEWPEDDVDRVMRNYFGLTESLGLDSI